MALPISNSGSSPSSSSQLTIVITGASRGFGRAMALVAAETNYFGAAADSGDSSTLPLLHLVLVARSNDGLQETARLLQEGSSSSSNVLHAFSVNVSCHAMDLSDLDGLDANMDQLLQRMENSRRVIFIQNAGTIGHLGPCVDSPSLKDMQANINLNVTSCLWSTVRVARYAKEQSKKLIIVQISSLAAIINDFPTMGVYSMGKAARDKYHSLLTKETPSVRTLNYAPGPLETDMVKELRQAEDLDTDLKPNFQQTLLSPKDSARKLMQLLQKGDFESGAHVDYYDLPEVDHKASNRHKDE